MNDMTFFTSGIDILQIVKTLETVRRGAEERARRDTVQVLLQDIVECGFDADALLVEVSSGGMNICAETLLEQFNESRNEMRRLPRKFSMGLDGESIEARTALDAVITPLGGSSFRIELKSQSSWAEIESCLSTMWKEWDSEGEEEKLLESELGGLPAHRLSFTYELASFDSAAKDYLLLYNSKALFRDLAAAIGGHGHLRGHVKQFFVDWAAYCFDVYHNALPKWHPFTIDLLDYARQHEDSVDGALDDPRIGAMAETAACQLEKLFAEALQIIEQK